MLKATGLAALGAGLSACASRRAASLVWPEPPRRFARMHVSEDRIIRTVVGLRPFRPSGFVVRTEKVDEPLQEWWEQSLVRDLYPESRELGPQEHPFPARYARRFTTMLIEPPIYLSAMLRDVRLAGGRIVVRELGSREQVQELPEPVVINCTGLGAKALFGDQELHALDTGGPS